MKQVVIFAGTTEGRKLSEYLAEVGVQHTVCVATEYGELAMAAHPMVKVHQERMNRQQIKEFLVKGSYAVAVDATHPYAEIITRNVKEAAEEAGIPYLRFQRETADKDNGVTFFEKHEDCAHVLERTEGNILLTIGSKELSAYCALEKLKDRLYVRILPSAESILLCEEHGICGKQVIAMQGPFTAKLNEAIMQQYGISCLVTKESGISGGYPQKIEAAARMGVKVFVIGAPREEGGYSFSEICRKLEKICQRQFPPANQMDIVLAGAGMGSPGCLTKEVQKAICDADILLGAERLVRQYHPKLEMRPFYLAEQIIPYLQEVQRRNLFAGKVVILFSGDSGFYSGCRLVYAALREEIENHRLYASLRILPGISSVAYFAAQIGESYQDADICSVHGKTLHSLIGRIRNNPRTFLLTSGVKDVNRLGELLLTADMAYCEVMAGYQLSYQGQRIQKLTPRECCEVKAEGLYICFVRNPRAKGRRLTHGRKDTEFVREQVPMTKEEVRDVSICKLQLHERAIVYDIGSGSGSVAVEIAALSERIQVYAIERKPEALSVLEKNRKRFGFENISLVHAEAPEAFAGLPMATHAFIGGSGGKLKEILRELYQCNPAMRVVVNAISMETICELKELLLAYPIREPEIVQLQANRVREIGQYHLLQAENPIWIFAFHFEERTE